MAIEEERPLDETQLEQTGSYVPAGSDRHDLTTLLDRQIRSWKQGQRVEIEQFLAEYPTLVEDHDALLELIVQEAILREQCGMPADLAGFQTRFPHLAEPLRIQWEVDRLLFSRLSARVDRFQQNAVSTGRPEVQKRIGRYEILGVLGKGGMGVAYRAYDPDLRRVVALKTLLRGDDDDERERFRVESEAVARVRHPGIVEVHDVGEHEGQLYFTMEFCTGGSLADRLKENPLSPQVAAQVVSKIAAGMAAAHVAQVIHRDLKPANILLVAALEPKITDFGLARKLDEDGRTRTGAIMGTPSYMAPEQALGDTRNLGPAVDIYALGAILYECLTGRPPFRGATVMETLDMVRNTEPVPVRQLQPRVPRDLETICHKCLHKEPGRRYASAEALGEDLQRYLDGRPIRARRVGAIEQTWRWCRRNPAVAGLLAAVFLSLTTGLVGMTLLYRQAVAARADAVARARDYEETSDQALLAVDAGFTRLSREKLLQQPGMTDLRRDLLSTSRPFLEWFVAKRQGDDRFRMQLARAHASLGEILGDQGNPKAGLEAYEKARRTFDEQRTADPNDLEAARAAFLLRVQMAQLYERAGFPQSEIRMLAEAVEMTEQNPTLKGDGLELADLRFRLASTQSQFLPVDEARQLYDRALAECREVYQRLPKNNVVPRFQYGEMRRVYGEFLLNHAKDPVAAQVELEAANELFAGLVSIPTMQFGVRRNLFMTLSLLAMAHHAQSKGNPAHREQGRKRTAEATSEARTLILQQPTNAMFRFELSVHLYKAAFWHRDWELMPEAIDLAREAADILNATRKAQGDNAQFAYQHWASLYLWSELLLTRAEQVPAEREALLRDAHTLADRGLQLIKAVATATRQSLSQAGHADALVLRARVRFALGRLNEAQTDLAEALMVAPEDHREEIETERARLLEKK